MICPRCGTQTESWPCPECGFPEIMWKNVKQVIKIKICKDMHND